MSIIAKASGSTGDFENVKVDEWINGEISDITQRLNTEAFKQTEDGELVKESREEVRIFFKLDGYKQKHSTYWMRLSMHEKSSLYTNIIAPLYTDKDGLINLAAGHAVDLEKLIGHKVKTMWENKTSKKGRVYQSLIKIKSIVEPPNIVVKDPNFGTVPF